jgi:hypothetical protein
MRTALKGFLGVGLLSALSASPALSQTSQSVMLVSHPAGTSSGCQGGGKDYYEFHQINGKGQTGGTMAFSVSDTFTVTDIEWSGTSSYSGAPMGPVELQLLSPHAIASSSGASPYAVFHTYPHTNGWASGGADGLQNIYVQAPLCARVDAVGATTSSYVIFIQGYVTVGSAGG